MYMLNKLLPGFFPKLFLPFLDSCHASYANNIVPNFDVNAYRLRIHSSSQKHNKKNIISNLSSNQSILTTALHGKRK